MKMEAVMTEAWYALEGAESDVVIASKIKLFRNLANFPFPEKLGPGEDERIQSIVLDGFNSLEDGDKFQAIKISQLDSVGSKVMKERGLCSGNFTRGGIILRDDGVLSCTVNETEHLCISSVSSGFEIDKVKAMSFSVDSQLQKKIQFAASYDFGYLTSSILNSGSGMKIDITLHLPCLSLLKKIPSFMSLCAKEKFMLASTFGSGSSGFIGSGDGTSLGSYYELISGGSCGGSEFDQIAGAVTLCRKMINAEREARTECKNTMFSSIKNIVFRALSVARSSIFVTLRESIDIISAIKIALDFHLIKGITQGDLHALLYRVQNGQLEFVLNNGSFNFEEDIENNSMKKNERLRALVLKEAFENLKLDI